MELILKKEIIAPIIIFLICALLCLISKKVINKIFNYKSLKIKDGRKKTIINLLSNVIKFVIIIIGLLTVLEVYGIDTKSLVASFGIVGLVVGLALQDILKDFIVGISIIFEGQFSIGDWVSINDFKGEVMPSNLRTTKIKAYTGEIKIISNRNISEIINYSLSSAVLVMDIDVSYDSDVTKVQEVLDNLCIKLKDKYSLKNIDCLGIQKLDSSSIKYRIIVSTPYSEQFSLDRKLKKEIVLELKKNNIEIPYNQVVIHNGKSI